ncbi:hypothetical protein [Kordia sp.]|uniref:hypothetical protein n=1 Tax=Kordia sp. TaxID=1965332 RepID=UPI003D28A5E8
MDLENKFGIGDIVTLKSHPLTQNHSSIKDLSLLVPPLMLVKEVYLEDYKNKKIFSEEIEKAQISDFIKYVCVYFCANTSKFEEKTLFESFLISHKELNFYRKDEVDENGKESISLIDEVTNYVSDFNYLYGKVVQFKTKKLEHRKSYEKKNNEELKKTSYQTPDFILSGIKKEPQEKLFYPNGNQRKITSEILYKVMWFNYVHQKFSEEYLPKKFFVEGLEI